MEDNCDLHCNFARTLKRLSDAGYRKLPEDSVVLSREEYDNIYEQAEANVLANIADGGTSCQWCIEQHEKKASEKFMSVARELEDLKQNLEDSVVLSVNDWIDFNKEHANELIKTREEEYGLGYNQGSKETAEKILKKASAYGDAFYVNLKEILLDLDLIKE